MLPGVSVARALCTVYIVCFWHVLDYSEHGGVLRQFFTYHLTVTALGTFCLISGFLLGRPAGAQAMQPMAFYKARVLKIYPLYLLALLTYLAVSLYDVRMALRGAVLISLWTEPSLPTLWFMAMVFFFYLLLPWFRVFGDSAPGHAAFAAVVLLVLAAYDALGGGLDRRVLVYLPCFVAGVCIRRYGQVERLRLGAWRIVGGAALMLATAWLSWWLGVDYERDFSSAPFALVSSVALFLACLRWHQPLGATPAVLLVDGISFIAYLFHRPVYKVLQKIYFPAEPGAQVLYAALVFVPMLLVACLLIKRVYGAVEKGLVRAAAH